MPEDRWAAISVAALRCEVGAGPGRDPAKAAMLWVPSRWQVADGLAKRGLAERLRGLWGNARARLHAERMTLAR